MKPSAVTSAVSSDNLEIPLIDFSAFLTATDEATKRTTAQAILEGFQKAGFIYLKNHGITPAQVKEAFSESAKFFKRPESQKMEMGWTTPEANRGYSQPGREKTTDATDPNEIEKIREREGVDLKESFEIGREGEKDHPNQWPDKFDQEGKKFKEKMLGFHDAVKQLHIQIMRAIAVGLGIEESWFDGYTSKGDNTLRLLHYPEVKHEVFRKNANTVRAGAHTDYGSITCLFQVSIPTEGSVGDAVWRAIARSRNGFGYRSTKFAVRLLSTLAAWHRHVRARLTLGSCVGHGRRAASAFPEWQLHRCHAHSGYHCGERRRSVSSLVE